MLIFLLACLMLGLASPLAAQPRPGAFTTLVTTNTGVTSVCVGGNTINAPSSCLGGLQAGPTVVNQALTLPSFTPGVVTNKLYNVGGNLFFNGLALATGGSVGPGTAGFVPVFTGANSIGNSLFSQSGTVMTLAGTLVSTVQGQSSFTTAAAGQESVLITNTAAGTGNSARLAVASNTVTAFLDSYSSTFTSSGASLASGSLLSSNGTAGLGLSASAGPLLFYAGSAAVRGQITAAGIWTYSSFGPHVFSAGGTGENSLTAINTTAGAGNYGRIASRSDTVNSFLDAYSSTFTTFGAQVQGGSMLYGDGVGGLSVVAAHAAGELRFYAGGTVERAVYRANGDYALATTGVTDSVAVPTITSGFGSGGTGISGHVYAFTVTTGVSGSPTTGVVAFNTSFAVAPTCVATHGSTGVISLTTTVATVTISTTIAWGGTERIHVLCRGR